MSPLSSGQSQCVAWIRSVDVSAGISSISSALFCEATRESSTTAQFSRDEKLLYKWKLVNSTSESRPPS